MPDKERKNSLINRITDWLYQGDLYALTDEEWQQHGIGAILCVANTDESPARSTVRYLRLPFNDYGEELTPGDLTSAAAFAEAFMDRRILVHCIAGVNRSVVMSGYLLAHIEGIDFRKAIDIVCAQNPESGPFPELIKKVEGLQEAHLGSPTRASEYDRRRC